MEGFEDRVEAGQGAEAPRGEEEGARVAETDSPQAEPREPLVVSDLLVEDVSIDGMCGVY